MTSVSILLQTLSELELGCRPSKHTPLVGFSVCLCLYARLHEYIISYHDINFYET